MSTKKDKIIYTCPACLGDGFRGWTQSKFRNKNRVYKKICLLCHGKTVVDWITNINKIHPKIIDSRKLISVSLAKHFGNYCFSTGLQAYFINEEFAIIKDIEKKWKHVLLKSFIDI